MTIGKLHFVYNVELSVQALVKDFVHRLIDPETYPCKLCDLTYGRFAKKPGWQLFVWSLPVQSAFCTKDVFLETFPRLNYTSFPSCSPRTEPAASRCSSPALSSARSRHWRR